MKEMMSLLSTSRIVLTISVLLGLVSGASGALLVWLIGAALSSADRPPPRLALGFVSVGVLALVTRVFFMGLLGRLQQNAVAALRRRLTRQILATSLRDLEEVGSARLHAALTTDIAVVSESLYFVPHLFISISSSVGCLAYLAWLSLSTFLIFVAFAGLAILSYLLPTRHSTRTFERAREREDDLHKHFRSLTDGLKELGLHSKRRADFLARCIDATSSELRKLHVLGNDIFSVASSWGMFLFFVFIGLLLFALPSVTTLGVSTLMGYAMGVIYLQQPLSAAVQILPIVNRGGVALRKIHSLGLSPVDALAADGENGDACSGFEQLRLHQVTHSYYRENEDTRFVLGPLDLTLERGETLFVVGGNGSGKTTLAKLITGLYAPDSGAVMLNGRTITTRTRDLQRAQFSAVFSDFHLFESLLGCDAEAATSERAQAYLAKLQLDRKVRLAGGRLSTTNLSQGQRKRLALLTAYLEGRPLYLFDEWTADQDPAFKEVFYRALLPELKQAGKTVVVITHDDRYFHLADRVLRLEHGALRELTANITTSSSSQHRGENQCPLPTSI